MINLTLNLVFYNDIIMNETTTNGITTYDANNNKHYENDNSPIKDRSSLVNQSNIFAPTLHGSSKSRQDNKQIMQLIILHIGKTEYVYFPLE